jgi:endonuclease/exonuclease/phosphatase (EEP) superfamily protein YafD
MGRVLSKPALDADPLDRLNKVLRAIWREQVRVKSDMARKEADVIAMAASLQLITTKVGAQRYAKTWLITSKGLKWLDEKED